MEMARRSAGDESERSKWSFSELLRWHFNRGTGPGHSVKQVSRPWNAKEFAAHAMVSDRTVRSWLSEKIPRDISVIERILFGKDPSLNEFRIELREAYHKKRESLIRQKDQNNSNAIALIDTFQYYSVTTPLNKFYSLFSASIIIGSRANSIKPIDEFLTHEIDNIYFSKSESVGDFIDNLVIGVHEFQHEEIRESIIDAFDKKYAVLYSGSINPVTTNHLSKIPTLLKGMASLSNRQFRVGLFRLSTTIIVIAVVSGGAAVGAKLLYEVAVKCISELAPNIISKR